MACVPSGSGVVLRKGSPWPVLPWSWPWVLRRARLLAPVPWLAVALPALAVESASVAVNPMTGEPAATEDLRMRLARLQIESRIEAELTSIERNRQERRRMGAGEIAPASRLRSGPDPRPRAARAPAPLVAPASGAGVPATVATDVVPTVPHRVGYLRDGAGETELIEQGDALSTRHPPPGEAPGSGPATAVAVGHIALPEGESSRMAQDAMHPLVPGGAAPGAGILSLARPPSILRPAPEALPLRP